MPERNVVQALFPTGSRVIPNPHGTAPGIEMDLPAAGGVRTARVFALPGVPAEMKEMWAATVCAAIGSLVPAEARRVIVHRVIKCFGVGESDLEAMLPDMIRRDRYPRVGITVSHATISLRVTAEEASPEACRAAMESTVATIHDSLKQLVFGEGEDTELQHVIGRMLAQRGATLATAEWGTAGVLSQWLDTIDNSQDVYRGGIVINSAAALAGGLGVSADAVRLYGTSSAAVARAMAEQARVRLHADFGLAVSAIPTGEAETFHLALATPHGTEVRPARTIGHPDLLRTRSAKQALDLLRLTLLNAPT
jgi:nicotinamide-nucleotide amidase